MTTPNNRGLKSRKNFASTLENNLFVQFDKLATETRIPKSKLLDEAIEDLINKHTRKNDQ